METNNYFIVNPEFIDRHIIFPQTKDINILKYLSNMGYYLYFEDSGSLINLKLVTKNVYYKLGAYDQQFIRIFHVIDFKPVSIEMAFMTRDYLVPCYYLLIDD